MELTNWLHRDILPFEHYRQSQKRPSLFYWTAQIFFLLMNRRQVNLNSSLPSTIPSW
jgi:hypothetical protein